MAEPHDTIPSPDTAVHDYVSLQRRALQALKRLSQEAVRPLEAEIEAARQSAVDEARQNFEEDQREIELYGASQKEDARKRLASHAETLTAEAEKQREAAESEARRQRDAANTAASEKERRLQQARDEALMETNFLTEGRAASIKQQHRETKNWLADAEGRLRALQERARVDVARYRLAEDWQTAPATSEQDEADTVQQFEDAFTQANQQLTRLARALSIQLLAGRRPLVWVPGLVVTVTVLTWVQSESLMAIASGAGLGLVGSLFIWFLMQQRKQSWGRKTQAS